MPNNPSAAKRMRQEQKRRLHNRRIKSHVKKQLTKARQAIDAPQGRIAFATDRDGTYEIYVMNVAGALQGTAGTNPRNLTHHPAYEWSPTWSPDGRMIAFESDRDGNNEIYVMNDDGSNPRRLTNNGVWDGEPAWSPDGRLIAFRSERDGNPKIYVMDADGSNPRRLTNNEQADDKFPAWSPDSHSLSFASNRTGKYQLYVMPVPEALTQVSSDGTNTRRLTNDSGDDEFSSWSHDGRLIAFVSNRDGNNELYVMPAPVAQAQVNADGTNPRRLTNNPADDNFPSWSPDGRFIAFQSARDGNNQIYVMNSDGTNPRRLTHTAGNDDFPAWAPR